MISKYQRPTYLVVLMATVRVQKLGIWRSSRKKVHETEGRKELFLLFYVFPAVFETLETKRKPIIAAGNVVFIDANDFLTLHYNYAQYCE